MVTNLQRRGVEIRSLTESLDASSPSGRLAFHVFASRAESERDLVEERTNAGLAAARAHGREGGRPTVVTREELTTALQMRDSGSDVTTFARVWGVSGPACAEPSASM